MGADDWSAWHFFPDTDPEEKTVFNPGDGDDIEIEYRDKLTSFSDATPIYRFVKWNGLPPKPEAVLPRLPPQYKPYRWRHRDPDTARRWKADRDASSYHQH